MASPSSVQAEIEEVKAEIKKVGLEIGRINDMLLNAAEIYSNFSEQQRIVEGGILEWATRLRQDKADLRHREARLLELRLILSRESSLAASSQVDAGVHVLNHRELVIDIAGQMPAPSIYGRTMEYSKEKYFKILHHRPPGPPEGGPHVSLFNEIFGNFMERCEEVKGFSKDEVKFAVEIQLEMRGVFENEKKRQESAVALITKFIPKIKLSKPAGIDPDESVIFCDAPAVIFEFKNEIYSTSCDPYQQAIGYYLQILAREECSVIGARTRCPAFLVTIAGPWLTFYGILNTAKNVLVDLLCRPLSLQPDPDQPKSTIQLCAALRAFKYALTELEQHYEKSRKNVDPLPVDSLSFPSMQNFIEIEIDVPYSLKYTKQLTPRVYRATTCNGREVVVKFSPIGCCEEAHLLLAKAGLAPAVVSFARLAPNWHVTVMSWVKTSFPSNLRASPQMDELVRAIRILHSNGFVHGDLRDNNVLVDTENRVFLIDFEFAGKAGEAIYPALLNTEIRRPDGVAGGSPLEFDHDLTQVSWLTAESTQSVNQPENEEQGRNPKRLRTENI